MVQYIIINTKITKNDKNRVANNIYHKLSDYLLLK